MTLIVFEIQYVDLMYNKRCIWILYVFGRVDFVVFDRVGY